MTPDVFVGFSEFIDAVQQSHYTGNKLMAEAARINPAVAATRYISD